MKKQEKNYGFIDSQNLNLGIRSQGWKLDFGRFRKYLHDKFSVTVAYIFIGYVDGNESLYASLQSQGYILIFKPTLYLPNGKVKGNVDAELVLHAMIQYQNYKRAIIVSGDGDFHCLIEYLRSKDKLYKIVIPDWNNYSSLLRKFMSKIIFMNQLRNKLEYREN
ncbi:NYN domain-containing protein [Patescibacteria group bacterium]|nr:NYN domain-containing protein [Patescibacteria group bacterium]MBU4511855.1 NYN domain-containing protein [Patescibacteria group bacterium]MCG2693250.1 NYN domain-containing protein [Candidatus Parcubacteria bacterium]